jgi:hypothetical protein
MTTISTRGWRRSEPGLVNIIEQPSLLPRAVELLDQEGIGEMLLIEQCRVPAELFHTVTSRAPENNAAEAGKQAAADQRLSARVVSLLDWQRSGASELQSDPSSQR